jgi:hypothetical protein
VRVLLYILLQVCYTNNGYGLEDDTNGNADPKVLVERSQASIDDEACDVAGFRLLAGIMMGKFTYGATIEGNSKFTNNDMNTFGGSFEFEYGHAFKDNLTLLVGTGVDILNQKETSSSNLEYINEALNLSPQHNGKGDTAQLRSGGASPKAFVGLGYPCMKDNFPLLLFLKVGISKQTGEFECFRNGTSFKKAQVNSWGPFLQIGAEKKFNKKVDVGISLALSPQKNKKQSDSPPQIVRCQGREIRLFAVLRKNLQENN